MILIKANNRPPQFPFRPWAEQAAVFLWRGIFCLFISCFFVLPVFAEKAAPGGTGQPVPQPTAFEQLVPFIFIGLLLYFILIRPQQRKARSHNQFLSNLKRGDEVLTASGIFGSIEGLTDQFVILEVAENVRIRVMKSQIASHTKSLESGEKSQ